MKTARGDRRRAGRGQMLVLFVVAIFTLMGIVAIVIDVSWYWTNSLRVQRAADAAALAGVIYLPGDVGKAVTIAGAEATKNGFTNPVGGCAAGTVCVTPVQDLPNPRRIKVTISAPVNTFFMKVFGINTMTATRTAKAEYVVPVPMGSPLNYYGVGLFIAATAQTGFKSGVPAVPCTGCSWTTPGNANGNDDNQYAGASNDGQLQQWGTFGLLTAPNAIPVGASVDGIEVQLDANYTGNGSPTNGCQVRVALSWDGGGTWAPTNPTDMVATLGSGEQTFNLGGSTNANAWTGHTWTRADFSDALFRVRLTFNKPSCAATRSALVDTLFVRISSNAGPRPVFDPYGSAALAPQNFWGSMQSQGSPNIQGDAFMTKYESRSPLTNNAVNVGQDPDAIYDSASYYNYGVDIPPGATNGEVWIYDPGFCAVASSQGTGENWSVGGSTGYSSAQPVSAYYELYNMKGTPYDLADDTLWPGATSGTMYQQQTGQDATLGGTRGSTNCSALAWHDGWWRLANGLTGGPVGTTYRVHVSSTDPVSPNDQNNTTAMNSFAIWATASGGTPRVSGSGAMEAYVRLPGGQASTFYLAQIDAGFAGKTMVIDLWDPGDTGSLSASLEILQPTSTGYFPATFKYQASKGTSDGNASNCNGLANNIGVTSVVTNTGGDSQFNGCWLRMTIALPSTYTAPVPPGETEAGWWKIRYTMGGNTNNFSTDMTTWKVAIKGNPVHLLVP